MSIGKAMVLVRALFLSGRHFPRSFLRLGYFFLLLFTFYFNHHIIFLTLYTLMF